MTPWSGGDLHEFAVHVARVAEEHGFDRVTWENLPTKLMFVVTEIDEAIDELENHEPALLRLELADIAIRTLAILGTLWPDKWLDSRIYGSQRKLKLPNPQQAPATLMRPILKSLCNAIGYWRNDNRGDAMQCLEFVLLDLYRLSDVLKLSLDQAMFDKNLKNESRERLHGKKRSEA